MASPTLLKEISSHDKVFADTCSLLEDSWPSFAKDFLATGTRLHVDSSVVGELRRHAAGKNAALAANARRVLDDISRSTPQITVTNPRQSGHRHADKVLLEYLTTIIDDFSLAVITQDRDFTYDLMGLNDRRSSAIKGIHVYRLYDDGSIGRASGRRVDTDHRTGEKKAFITYDTVAGGMASTGKARKESARVQGSAAKPSGSGGRKTTASSQKTSGRRGSGKKSSSGKRTSRDAKALANLVAFLRVAAVLLAAFLVFRFLL